MAPPATAEKPDLKSAPEPEEPETGQEPEPQDDEQQPAAVLGQVGLFLSEEYVVTSIEATLGGITEDVDAEHPLYGIRVGDEGIDLVIRNVKVTGGKATAKGKVSLILTGTELDVLKPKGLED